MALNPVSSLRAGLLCFLHFQIAARIPLPPLWGTFSPGEGIWQATGLLLSHIFPLRHKLS